MPGPGLIIAVACAFITHHRIQRTTTFARLSQGTPICISGPGESPPSRAWSTSPAKGRRRTAASGRRGGGCRRTHGKPCWLMRSNPLGVHPRNLPARQDHPYVLRRLRDTLRETQRDGLFLCDLSRSPAPHIHTPSEPHKRWRTDTGGSHSTPGALRATQHDVPDPPASGAAT